MRSSLSFLLILALVASSCDSDPQSSPQDTSTVDTSADISADTSTDTQEASDTAAADTHTAADTSDAQSDGDATEPVECPDFQARIQGACVRVGIQECAEAFIGDDGLCRPSSNACPGGTIPEFHTGCVPVGIPGCVPELIDDDGLCHPTPEACPNGTIPRFDEGCVTVGIEDCAPVFIGDDGLCHPTQDACPDGTFAVPTQGCVSIDGAQGCGTDTFGHIADSPGTIYVDRSYSGTSTGSRDQPVTSINAALSLVQAGGRIAIAAGTYPESIDIPSDVEVIGRCASMVRISGFGSTPQSIVKTVWFNNASNASLSGVTVRLFGILTTGGSNILIDEVAIDAQGWGLRIQGGSTIEVSNTRIEVDSANGPGGTRILGKGITLSRGAEVSVDATAIVSARHTGAEILGANTRLSMTDSLIEGTLPQESDQEWGWGLVGGYGAQLTLHNTALVSNTLMGLAITDNASNPVGGSLTATHILIEDTQTHPTFFIGRGMLLSAGVTGTVADSAFLGNRTEGILAYTPNTTLKLSGSLIRGTLPNEGGDNDQSGGYALNLQNAASAVLNDNAFIDNHFAGLYVHGNNTTLEAHNNLIANTQPRATNQAFGSGLILFNNASATLTGNAFVGNHRYAIEVPDWASASQLVARNNLLADTLPDASSQAWGGGVRISADSNAELTANAILDNASHGVSCSQNATVTLEANLIQDSGSYGALLACSQITLDRNTFHGNTGTSIYLSGKRLTQPVTMTRNLIEFTAVDPNEASPPIGLLHTFGGTLEMAENAFLGNATSLYVTEPDTTLLATFLFLEGDTFLRNSLGAISVREAELNLASSVLRSHAGAGASANFNGSLSLTDSLIQDTRASDIVLADGTIFEDVGDGVLVFQSGTADLDHVLLANNARAGLIFDNSPGLLNAVESRNNTFGIVVQGDTQPEAVLDPSNIYEENTEQNVVSDGNLSVPDRELATPTPPPQCVTDDDCATGRQCVGSVCAQ